MRIIGDKIVKTPCDGLREKYGFTECVIDEAWYRGQMRYLEQLSAQTPHMGHNAVEASQEGKGYLR